VSPPDLSPIALIVATPLLFAYIVVAPPVPSAGVYPERIVPGLLFGLVVLGLGLWVEPDDG